jgi:hypothetical protein
MAENGRPAVILNDHHPAYPVLPENDRDPTAPPRFGDTAAADGILARFLHHAEVIRLQGRSYRMHNRRELRSKQAEEALTTQTR